MAILGHRTFTLEYLNRDRLLIVRVGGESLSLLRGNNGVTVDDLRHHSSNGFNTERKGSDVKEHDRLRLIISGPGEDPSLDRSTKSNSFVGINALVRFPSEIALHELLYFRDASRSSNKHDLMYLSLRESSVLEHVLNWLHSLSEQIHVQLLKTSSGQGL
mmetsp:Transcript_27109/g.105522  ORF Transcript_27109/g.105522 Transcript_27109/m.105522 type:complete len:160 (+) Transcript_27109:797-1276(+)